ncbi:MAG: hypothetical protein LBQ70_01840 [Prevotellaceae bacterium]|nr:hypothetical protein [Prevotellaceae bacterium]
MKRRKIDKIITPHVLLNPHDCKACWACIDTCPSKVIGKVSFLWHKHALIINSGACTGCLKCVKTCSAAAFIPLKNTTRHDGR